MERQLIGLSLLFCAWLLSGLAVLASDTKGKTIALGHVGTVDSKVISGVEHQLVRTFRVRVERRKGLDARLLTEDDRAETISSLVSTKDLCMILLSREVAGKRPVSLYHDARTAVVNIGALEYGKAGNPGAVSRRVHRAAVSATGHLLGMGECPNLRCVMAKEYPGAEDLDKRGQSLCPPCRGEAEKILTRSGAKRVTEVLNLPKVGAPNPTAPAESR